VFDVGFTEILLIGVVALVVIGPERLPEVARNVGRYVGKLQRFVTGVKRDIRQELETGELKKLLGDQKEQIEELRKAVDTTRRQVDSGARELGGHARKTLAGLEKATDGSTDESSAASAGKAGKAGKADKGGDGSAPVSTRKAPAAPDMTKTPTPAAGYSAGALSGDPERVAAATRPPAPDAGSSVDDGASAAPVDTAPVTPTEVSGTAEPTGGDASSSQGRA